MATQYTSENGNFVKPGAYPDIKVATGAGGLSTTGTIAIVGEADAGPDYSLETDLESNSFGPDQLSQVLAKYVSGPIVEGYRAYATPANDPRIPGAPNRFIIAKTNASTKAGIALDAVGGGNYATLYDKSYGRFGSLIYFTVAAKTAEVKPTTGSFTYIPTVGTVNLAFRVNGDVAQNLTVGAVETPTDFVAAVEALNDISASGGADRTAITFNGAHTLALTHTPATNIVTITKSTAWTNTPVVGDTLLIPVASVLKGASQENVGAYVVTAATATTLTATKLSDAGKASPSPVIGTITEPADVGAVPESTSATHDMVVYTPAVITLTATDVIDGQGKTLEIADLGTGTDTAARAFKILGSTTSVTWSSTSASPKLIVSATEYSTTLAVSRQLDGISESFSAGGQIALKLGYYGVGATCQVVVSSTRITATVTGGTGDNFDLMLKDFPTLNDLASYLNSQPGYTCAVGSAAIGSYGSSNLDEGTFFAGATHANYGLRLKVDAAKFYAAVSTSNTVQLGNPVASAPAGLPAVMATPTYLVGGLKGATTNASVIAALVKLEGVKLNIVCPQFSRDAADDIADEITDSGSTYDIASINAAVKTHILKMSTVKRRRRRQAALGFRGSFDDAKAAAQTLACYRAMLCFQDVKVEGSNGLYQAQPHVLAGLAAGMQAAGFYRDITGKGINCNGIVSPLNDYDMGNDTDAEDALLAGLNPAQKSEDGGGFVWVSDQTTYSADDNFVFNSFQAVYASDIMGASAGQRMERMFMGESPADFSAATILAAFQTVLADFLRLKLIAASDDAPKGYRKAKVTIGKGAAVCEAELKLAGSIKFLPINFLLSQVSQSAG